MALWDDRTSFSNLLINDHFYQLFQTCQKLGFFHLELLFSVVRVISVLTVPKVTLVYPV